MRELEMQVTQSSRRYPLTAALKRRACLAIGMLTAVSVLANGGPFVIKYPGGDPAAKGVLARLDPGLRPGREARLQVMRENLSIRFGPDSYLGVTAKEGDARPPLVAVSAEYLITNTTAQTVEVDFGFPILRGVYIDPFSMMPMPDAQVWVDGTNHRRPTLISNSAIYGILRRNAVQTIRRGLDADAKLSRLFREVKFGSAKTRDASRQALVAYLTSGKCWPVGDAVLLAEYAALEPADDSRTAPQPSSGSSVELVRHSNLFWWDDDVSLAAAKNEAAWAVNAIGEQKATQWFTGLAGRFDPASAAGYEAIFQSWGGDVRERSVDLQTGRVRPREISLPSLRRPDDLRVAIFGDADPTVYARVDYFSEDKNMTDGRKASWQSVLKHLPVIFTFAPLNLLHYRVAFEGHAVRTVTVTYRQYAYLDTHGPPSYQIAYVVHPASLWESFGPIHLTVSAPRGVIPVASVPLHHGEDRSSLVAPVFSRGIPLEFGSHTATLKDKTGELLVAISAEEWGKAVSPTMPVTRPGKVASDR